METNFPQKLEELSAGFQRAQVLFTALRTNIFAHLQAPRTAEELAHELSWSPRGMRMLLDALYALDLLEKQGGSYQNAEIARQCLVPDAPQEQRHILMHKGNGYERWARLEEAVRTGAAPAKNSPQRSQQELRAFILGMENIARTSAQAIHERIDLSEHRVLLDIGTGPGTYAITFLKQFPQMKAILFDIPEVLPITREEVTRAGMGDRVEFVAGDLSRFEFSPGYDLVLISNVAHIFNPAVNQDLLHRCFKGLAPGGRLIIKDFLVDAERSGPPFSLMFALQMLLNTEGGDVYTTEEVAAWTNAAGFETGELLDLTEQTKLWVVRKPKE